MTSPSPTPSPLSPEVSDNSAVSQTPPKPQIDGHSGAGGSNGVVDSQEKKPETVVMFEDTDSKEDIEKYKKLEADYTHYLNAKYFSNKDIFGGIIFDEKTAINNGTIKSSRWPGTRSYADPLRLLRSRPATVPPRVQKPRQILLMGNTQPRID